MTVNVAPGMEVLDEENGEVLHTKVCSHEIGVTTVLKRIFVKKKLLV
jgi:hypothetical protein